MLGVPSVSVVGTEAHFLFSRCCKNHLGHQRNNMLLLINKLSKSLLNNLLKLFVSQVKETNSTIGSMTGFADLLVELSRHDVKYILVGGVAVTLCGYPRVTHDIDIIVEHSKKNIDLLIKCLLSFGEGSAKELVYQDFDLEEGCVRVVEDFPLDIFTLMRGNTYQELLKYVEFYESSGVQIPYLGAEGLIELKKESLRPKDQIDVQALKVIRS